MEQHTEAGEPGHLENITLSTTPQQSFEAADRMLVQAAQIKECAEELYEHVQAMFQKADVLPGNASDLKRYGMEERRKAAEIFDGIIVEYAWILPRYNNRKPHELANMAQAVKEGRAFSEEVEYFRDKLRAYVRLIGKNTTNAYVVKPGTDNEDDPCTTIQPGTTSLANEFRRVLEFNLGKPNANVLQSRTAEHGPASLQPLDHEFQTDSDSDDSFPPY